MKYTFLLLILFSFNVKGQTISINPEMSYAPDTVSKFVDFNSRHFKLMYIIDPSHYFEPAIGIMIMDSNGRINQEAVDRAYVDIRHYDASITVYRQNNDSSYSVIKKNIHGIWVKNGCFEDVPENWVKEALKK